MTTDFTAALRALKDGDGPAWARLLGEYRPLIQRYAKRLGARDAEDVTGATLEAVARTIGTFSGSESQFRSWVFTIAHARVVDDHRRRTRRPEVELGRDIDRFVDDRIEGLFSGDERIEAALGQLTAEQRQLLHLRHVVGLSIREIASITGRSEESARVAIHRCAKRLRGLLVGETRLAS